SGIASLAAAAGKLNDARTLVNAKLAATPNHPGLLFLSAKIAIVANDHAGAEKLLRHVLEVDPTNMQAYTLLGQVFVAQPRIAEAKQEFTRIAERQPTSIPAHTMLGLLCQAERDVDCAIKWYEKTVQIDEKHAGPAANNLAWIYLTRNANIEVAIRLAESAKAQLPNQAEVHDTLGWAYFKKGQLESALPPLRRATELDPSNPLHHYHPGMTLAKKGDDALARKSLEQALKLKPDFDGASLARTTLDSLVY